MKILTVCLGNICRSPMAEGIIRHKVKERGLDVQTDSAGTSNYHVGDEPDHRAIAAMHMHRVDITDLRGRQVKAKDLDDFDLILTMDNANFQDVIKLAATDEQRAKVRSMLSFRKVGGNDEVPDPYYGGSDDFDHVYRLLDDASENILDLIEAGKI